MYLYFLPSDFNKTECRKATLNSDLNFINYFTEYPLSKNKIKIRIAEYKCRALRLQCTERLTAIMNKHKSKSVAVIVAHPDDETLWAGGTILSHPDWNWFIVCLCRGKDKERAPKFYKTLKVLRAKGIMGDVDDGPDQKPLDKGELEKSILKLLPSMHFDLIISHNPNGEYTRHIRHEEIGKTVIELWKDKKISADELWTFAYEDDHQKYYPRPIPSATVCNDLSEYIWQKKYSIITDIYGFEKKSFEAETTPWIESFWQFTVPAEAQKLFNQFENERI